MEAAGSSKKARKESSDRSMIHVLSSRETEALEDACSRHGSRVGVLLMWDSKRTLRIVDQVRKGGEGGRTAGFI